jgi:hypothetical protein
MENEPNSVECMQDVEKLLGAWKDIQNYFYLNDFSNDDLLESEF